jgi:hypothetical protein
MNFLENHQFICLRLALSAIALAIIAIAIHFLFPTAEFSTYQMSMYVIIMATALLAAIVFYFGFKKLIKDERKPIIQGIVVYPLDSTTVNNAQKPINISFNKQADGNYLCTKVKANGRIAFGINAYDYCTNAYNKNGLYKVKAYLNGVLQYQYGFDTLNKIRILDSLQIHHLH